VVGSCEHGNEPLGFTEGWGISRVDEKLLASRERLNSMELVS
jgi:hypothetical protein